MTIKDPDTALYPGYTEQMMKVRWLVQDAAALYQENNGMLNELYNLIQASLAVEYDKLTVDEQYSMLNDDMVRYGLEHHLPEMITHNRELKFLNL